MNFIMLINVQMPTVVGISTCTRVCISTIYATSESMDMNARKYLIVHLFSFNDTVEILCSGESCITSRASINALDLITICETISYF